MIRLDEVCKRHGSQILFLDGCLSVLRGERVGIVGPNGAGKSTILRLIVGEEEPDGGTVVLDRDIRVGYFDQRVGDMQGCSVLEQTMRGAGEVAVIGARLRELESAMADPSREHELDALIGEFGDCQARFDELDGYALDSRARSILAGLGFAEDRIEADVGLLSGGWKMRVMLARILLQSPDLLLLDEPTNHLDVESIIWLERFLKDFAGGILLVAHDRQFMNRMVTKLVEIDGGELTTYSGNYEFYLQQRAIAQVQAEARFARQQAMLAKEEAFIARFKARASHAAQVQSRVKMLDKIERVTPPRRRQVVAFDFLPAPRSGDDVVKLRGVGKTYGSRTVLHDFDLLLRRKERWCVMGINGAGKTTLLKIIAGAVQTDAGSVTIGSAVKLGYFAQQSIEQIDDTATALSWLEGRFPRASQSSLRQLAGAFGFIGDDVEKKTRILSGGERARLVLAAMLFDPPNFLVLDEPTNHLDLDTKQTLTAALREYEGTMIFVSHDRQFLSEIATRVLELGPEGPRSYPGNYLEYVEQTGQEAPGLQS